MMETLRATGPAALITKRKMCPGIKGLEGETHGHDVIPVDTACEYLQEKGYPDAVAYLKSLKPDPSPLKFVGSSKDKGANRSTFGEAVNGVLDRSSAEDNKKKIMVIDSDLAGSTGLAAIKKKREWRCGACIAVMRSHSLPRSRGVHLVGYLRARKLQRSCWIWFLPARRRLPNRSLLHLRCLPRDVHFRDHNGSPQLFERPLPLCE